jgi:hypothetical protein
MQADEFANALSHKAFALLERTAKAASRALHVAFDQ